MSAPPSPPVPVNDGEGKAPTVYTELRDLVRQNRPAVSLAYFLLVLENLLRLAQPFLLGLAVNNLLENRTAGLYWFLAGHGAHMAIRFARQMYDTRVYARMYAERVTGIVTFQRKKEIPTSRVAARAALSRQFINFVEQQIPQIVTALFSCVGAVAMLFYYQWSIVVACLTIAVPVFILNWLYSRSVRHVSRDLHDQWEHEVQVIEQAEPAEVSRHYHSMTNHWIRISDLEARTAGLTELFVMGLMAFALLTVCNIPGIKAGDIFAVFRYLMMFVMGIDTVPRLVEQFAKLKDIVARL